MASLIPNDYLLDLNRSLMVPHDMELPAPWNLPSRMFQFPISVSRAAEDGSRRFGLRHPLLADHPFVKAVEAELGTVLKPAGLHGERDDGGERLALWWHAVDFMRSGHWQ